MKIKKVEGTDGYILLLNDDVHIMFTGADAGSDYLVSYLHNNDNLSIILYGSQSKQFAELWKAIKPVV